MYFCDLVFGVFKTLDGTHLDSSDIQHERTLHWKHSTIMKIEMSNCLKKLFTLIIHCCIVGGWLYCYPSFYYDTHHCITMSVSLKCPPPAAAVTEARPPSTAVCERLCQTRKRETDTSGTRRNRHVRCIVP